MSGSADPPTIAGALPHLRTPPARIRAWDDSPQASGTADPSHCDASVGTASLAVEGVSSPDVDPCSTAMSSEDALVVSPFFRSASNAVRCAAGHALP
jgi:hypothetical protein